MMEILSIGVPCTEPEREAALYWLGRYARRAALTLGVLILPGVPK